MATIIPAPGRGPETAALLLSLAAHPNQVQVTTDVPSGFGFVVPDGLHAKYLEELGVSLQAPGEETAPAPKKRGRPRKTVESTDSTELTDQSTESPEE